MRIFRLDALHDTEDAPAGEFTSLFAGERETQLVAASLCARGWVCDWYPVEAPVEHVTPDHRDRALSWLFSWPLPNLPLEELLRIVGIPLPPPEAQRGRCPVEGCANTRSERALMCDRCWQTVPKAMQQTLLNLANDQPGGVAFRVALRAALQRAAEQIARC